MFAGNKAVCDCIKAFSETDFTEDLKKLTYQRSSCTENSRRRLRCAFVRLVSTVRAMPAEEKAWLSLKAPCGLRV